MSSRRVVAATRTTSNARSSSSSTVTMVMPTVTTVMKWCAVCALAALSASAATRSSGPADASSLWCPPARGAVRDAALRRILAEGPGAWGDSGTPADAPPAWMDAGRLAAGRAFTARHPVALLYAHVHALYLLFAVPSVLDVLVYTGNSDTPDEAFVRYLDTVTGVLSWYRSDVFAAGSLGHGRLREVRALHDLVRRDMNRHARGSEGADAVRNRTRLRGDFSGCPLSAAMRADLDAHVRRTCGSGTSRTTAAPPADEDNAVDDEDGEHNAEDEERRGDGDRVWMSQYDMAVTQWAFVGPLVQFPERYGLANATDAELDGFTHLWEVLGHALGIEDRFNFCQGGLAATRARSDELLSAVVLPALRAARPPWEYMARCMADGLGYALPGVDFGAQLAALLGATLGVDADATPALARRLGAARLDAADAYRGVMRHLRRDGARGGRLNALVAALSGRVMDNLGLVPKDLVKRLRHRPPHRSRSCHADLET